MKRVKCNVKLVLIPTIGILLALFLLGRYSKTTWGSADTYENLKVFTEVISLIERNYVEEVNSKDLVEGAHPKSACGRSACAVVPTHT